MIAPKDWSGRLAVTGLGMVTPVGLDTPSTVAALRGGISRLADLPDTELENADGEPAPVTGASVRLVADGRLGPDRLAEMACTALREAIRAAGLGPDQPTAVFLGVPSTPWADRLLDHEERIAGAVEEALADVRKPERVRILPGGRAAALTAMRRAAAVLSERGDLVALVGGVDSWVGPIGVDWLQEDGRLREGPKASGILPGEGAAFLALETPESAASRGATVHAHLVAAAGAVSDVAPGDPTKGRILSAVLKRVGVRQSVATPLVVSDLNGERHRAFEWMFAFTRGGIVHDRDFRHWHAAECIGDAGAALGAIGAAWAVGAMSAGHVHEKQAVVWGASDEGAREALLLETGTED